MRLALGFFFGVERCIDAPQINETVVLFYLAECCDLRENRPPDQPRHTRRDLDRDGAVVLYAGSFFALSCVFDSASKKSENCTLYAQMSHFMCCNMPCIPKWIS